MFARPQALALTARPISLALVGLLLLAAGAGAVIRAESSTVTVDPGPLSLTTNPVALATVTLNGLDQNTSNTVGDVTWQAIDARGLGTGWHVTVKATAFTGGVQTLPAGSDLTISLQQADVTTIAGSAAPSTLVASATLVPDAAATPLKFLQAAAGGTGMGTYDFDPLLGLVIPAESFAESYTSTLTVDIVAGP